ncbi:MAG: beta-carotene ketolase [Synechococcaceae cyanobacterium RL_1_2]|nr:beta-carotene ketolase [Synechococcaceae cyanobacterium RL_1_2]
MVTTTILGLWCIDLCLLLGCDLKTTHPLEILLGILWQTFLDTGLFITAHEAMHGLVCPHNPQLNRRLGVLAITLYGLFPYDQLLIKHRLHHRYPASDHDPDFHNGVESNEVAWYLHFLQGYWNWRQFSSLLAIVIGLGFIFHLAPANLGLFWALPLGLSSLQLFHFGTFLPHRQPLGGYDNFARASSTKLSTFLSFITCYHFGYHREHHEHPEVPWWRLPAVYAQSGHDQPKN